MGFHFSGLIAWAMWRAIYLSKLPGLQKKVRVALDWTLDLFFSKDIVQLRALPSPSQLGVGHRPAVLANEKPSPTAEPRGKIA